MAYSGVATLGFIGTNGNKVFEKEDWTRIPVLTGQVINALDEASNLNSQLAGKTCKLITTCENMAKSDKLFGSVFNAGKFIKNNINPLIVASGVTKVALTKKEDREKAFITEGGMLCGMFSAEGFMKRNLDGYLAKITFLPKKILPIVKGVVFLSASLTGSSLGRKLGKEIANIWDVPLDPEARLAMESSRKNPDELSIKA
ncbi:hypothetical protein IJ472_07450 [bacterium]|nr:hypothetical protein [bacterium]